MAQIRTGSKSPVKPTRGKPASKTTGKRIRSVLPLDAKLLRHMFQLMLKSRVLEERLIKIYKAGDGFFWIGGPGEEGFGVPLGLLAQKGQGPNYDYFHLHYRATPTLIALGMPMIHSIRLIMNKATDVCTGGRNFSNHYCFPEWNVTPVSSPIEVQYGLALGTAHVQKRRKANGITIVTGGDAGSAEGDFASCLIWASRPKQELPMLITVQNNRWGISTEYGGQHGEQHIADRGKAFGIRTLVIDGNDPVETYKALQTEMSYIRKHKKPVLLEAMVSRLYGHSSATGANLIPERDTLIDFQRYLLERDVISAKESETWRADFEAEAKAAQDQVRLEPAPKADSIWDCVYANDENGDWRKF